LEVRDDLAYNRTTSSHPSAGRTGDDEGAACPTGPRSAAPCLVRQRDGQRVPDPVRLAEHLGVARDLYYGFYAAAVVGLFVAWARDTQQPLREMLARRWQLAVGLGVVFAAISAFIATRAEDGTAHPDGIEFVAALFWRGIVYGAADGLLLSAFPILLVFAALRDSRVRQRAAGLVAVGAVAMIASLAMTAAYHAGYDDFRSDKLQKPVTGDLVWSVPTLATLNPVGAPIAHVGLHVGAVTHNYQTDLFLPPH
jgi:hypothetical protein